MNQVSEQWDSGLWENPGCAPQLLLNVLWGGLRERFNFPENENEARTRIDRTSFLGGHFLKDRGLKSPPGQTASNPAELSVCNH